MTTTYIALLRGINVGGNTTLAMADLRRVLAALGHADVATYVRSGNAVFTSDRTDTDAMGAELTERLSTDLGVAPTVMIRTAQELVAIAEANPYLEQARADPTRVHVGFLSAEPADPSAFSFDRKAYAPEELTHDHRTVYLHLPNGIGRSKLAADLARRARDVELTMRNWRTVTRLIDMA